MIFFEPAELQTPGCTVRFTAKDGENALGSCDLLLHDGVADLVALELAAPDFSVAEELLRSALNYAANRGLYLAVFSLANADDVRALLPFEQKDGVWCGDIPTLLAGSCGKN